MDNHCVMCGAYLADTGRMVCEKCEKPEKETKKHECVIGLFHHYEGSELVTISELQDQITDRVMYNIMLKTDPILKGCKELRKKEWTLADYGDKRKNTNLTRFDYCPECGKVIDWKAIRRAEDESKI